MENTPIFSSYVILNQIGLGGMATVYLAEHKTLGHSVAIKVLNKEFTFNQNIRSRFVEEAKKMVRMNHPNVVKVTDLIDEENTVAIVMEYVDGKTLTALSAEHKFTDAQIELYLKLMLQALSYIHNQGLIHRDIKPSNFILGKDGRLKLTDFGISKSFLSNSDLTQTSTSLSMGTPMYMSPEQVRSTKDVTHLTDIYSLGVILWQLVSGQKPYNSETTSAFDLQLKIVQEDLPITHSHWDTIIQKATQKEELKRFQSAEEFLMALENKEIIEDDLERTIISQKVILPKQELIEVAKSQQEKGKKKRILAFASICIFLIICFFFVLNNLDNKKLDAKKQNQLSALKEIKKKEIENREQQNILDSLKLYVEQKKNDSLKLLRQKKTILFGSEKFKSHNLKQEKIIKIGDYLEGGYIIYLQQYSDVPIAWVIAPYDQGVYSQKDAKIVCDNLSLNGFSDWQLPSISTLLYDITPNIYLFPNIKKGLYWSFNHKDGEGSVMNFEKKEYYIVDESSLNNVRAIRKVYLDPKFDYLIK